MKNLGYLAIVVLLPLVLSACTPAAKTNANTNTVVIDLVNESASAKDGLASGGNTASVQNQNMNSNANVATNGNVNSTLNVNTGLSTAITVTASGFSPSPVTVNAGTVVTWTNSSGADIRVSSDPHPTHTDLPGLDSAVIANGGTYSFTFLKVGTWGYHNHEDPTMKGGVIVQ